MLEFLILAVLIIILLAINSISNSIENIYEYLVKTREQETKYANICENHLKEMQLENTKLQAENELLRGQAYVEKKKS